MPFLSASSKCTKTTAPAAQEIHAGKAPSPPRTSLRDELAAKWSSITPSYLSGSSLMRRSPLVTAGVIPAWKGAWWWWWRDGASCRWYGEAARAQGWIALGLHVNNWKWRWPSAWFCFGALRCVCTVIAAVISFAVTFFSSALALALYFGGVSCNGK